MMSAHIYRHGTQKFRYMATKQQIPKGVSVQEQLASPDNQGADWHSLGEVELDNLVLSEPERERIGSEIETEGFSFFEADQEILQE